MNLGLGLGAGQMYPKEACEQNPLDKSATVVWMG